MHDRVATLSRSPTVAAHIATAALLSGVEPLAFPSNPPPMARAATGLTEVVCWQFMLAGVGGVGALIFFLVLGAMNGMEPKPKSAEVLAPEYVPSKCLRWEVDSIAGAGRNSCAAEAAVDRPACEKDLAAEQACADLKSAIETKLTPAVVAQMLAAPCDLSVTSDPGSPSFNVAADLGFYWQAVCRTVHEGVDCAAEADRPACEKDLATKEATCAFLGLAYDPMTLTVEDVADPATCNAYLDQNTVNQAQADRCATSPGMAWETLYFITGGDYVTTSRCSAVTYAALVNQGTTMNACKDADEANPSYNSVSASADYEHVNELCTPERDCIPSVLTDLVTATDKGLPVDSTWAVDATTKVTTTTCERGYEASGDSAGYFCSHVPYTNAAGYPLAEGGAVVAPNPNGALPDVAGTWVGGLQCDKRECPTQCGSALGSFIKGDASRTTQRDPPEGLDDTCCSGEFGDICQIKCERGYKPAVDDVTGDELPHTCTVLDAAVESQDDVEWSGASCTPKMCIPMRVANTNGPNNLADGTVGQLFDYPDGCAAGFMQVGSLACQTSLLYQGGGCSARPTASITDPAIAAAASTAQGSSNANLVRDAFDGDPATYWFSTRADPVSSTSPDTLTITLPAGETLIPLSFSVQLGKSTDWASFLIKPRAFKLHGLAVDATDWFQLFSKADGGQASVYDPAAVSEQTNWYPACNDVSLDPINCFMDSTDFSCPHSSLCVDSAGAADASCPTADDPNGRCCNHPTEITGDTPCGPTEFTIDATASGEFNSFKFEVTEEYTDMYRNGARYGQIYIQDIAIMAQSSITTMAGGTETLFVPEATTCCGANGACDITSADVTLVTLAGTMSFAACADAAAEDAAAQYMQYVETGGGYCYTLATKTDGPAYIPAGENQGAMCWGKSAAAGDGR